MAKPLMKVSKRSDIPMFRALDILRQVNERTAKGIDVRRMGAGQPNVGAPQAALEYAISKIVSDPRQGYTEAVGMPALRERIAAHYQKTYLPVDLFSASLLRSMRATALR
jgi:aspartate/methionine/tyrosine aminotransferase